jgi:hypothetical protein
VRCVAADDPLIEKTRWARRFYCEAGPATACVLMYDVLKGRDVQVVVGDCNEVSAAATPCL